MIVTKGLTKRFSDIVAADHISVEIPEGCIYGLVGANGSGKSTFLRLLSGVYKPDEGEVLVDGQPVFDNPASKKKFVFVPDELFFLPQSNMRRMAALYETVYENFDYEMLSSLTETFNLTTERPFNTFSKGMKRQAATILALSARADYIFFDETFDGLDPVMRQLVKRTLYREVVDRNATAILTSHSLRELEDTCDQLALLYRGGLVFEGDVSSVKTSLFKIQVAFSQNYTREKFAGLELLAFDKQGSVSTMIVRGDRDRATNLIATMDPVLLEVLPLTLEEVFVHEMAAVGYSFGDAAGKGELA